MMNLGITASGSLLFAAWAGSDSDQQLWYSTFNGSSWAPPAQIPGESSVGPSLAVGPGGTLYAAWKGSGSDETLWYSSFNGSSWAPQAQIPGAASSVGPSLAAFQDPLYAAWKGSGSDETLWYSSFNGSSWAPQAQIPGTASPVGPSLAVAEEFAVDPPLYAAWAGTDSDQQLWYSSFNGSSWAAQAQIPGESSVGPSLAAFNGLLYAVWLGSDGDQRLWYSSFNGSSWAPQAQIPGAQAAVSDPVPVPAAGLGGNSNYILASDCNSLINVSVTINVTEDIVWQSASGQTDGFGFQLNAYSPTGARSAQCRLA